MNEQKPIIIDQAELAWEGWDDPDLAAKSEIRWKLLVTGERGPSSGLVMGVAGVSTRYTTPPSPPRARGDILRRQWERVTCKSTITKWRLDQVRRFISLPTPNMLSAVSTPNRWYLCSPSRVTASTK